MEMSFRWYGKTDSIPLEYIRQIPRHERDCNSNL